MSKNLQNILTISVLIGIIAALIFFTNKRSEKDELISNVAEPFITTIINKKVISGNLYPEKEIAVNSAISGILDEYFVSIGDLVQKGDNIAKVRMLPDPSQFESAKRNLLTSQIDFDNNKINFNRDKKLFDKGVISEVENEASEKAFEMSKIQFESAKNQLRLLEEGYIPSSNISNIVKAVTNGTITDLPLEVGEPVVERNNFREGSTIAIIAKLDKYVFKADVVENEVLALHIGDEINITPSSYDNITTPGTISKISPRGKEINGLMRYEIEAILNMPDSLKVYSGFNAIAEIEVQSADSVLAVKEKDLIFEGDSVFIYTRKPSTSKIGKQYVKIGISDGIITEIITIGESDTPLFNN